MMRAVLASSLLALFGLCAAEQRTVVVTGATGRTGSLLYKRLKAEGIYNVRAFVRNATKAKDVLSCASCDESEGVYEGDITDPASLKKVMTGADALAIATSSSPVCHGVPFGPFGKCAYPKGAEPKVIDFQGTKAQVTAFALAGGDLASKHVLYVSTMDTTVPDNFLDKIDNGHVSFFHLQAEAFIMSSGIPFTITKACGLGDGAAGKNKMIVGHDDASFSLILDHVIPRDDVARVLVEAIRDPAAAAGLRFDLCTQALGKPTTDIANDVLKAARLPWDHRGKMDTSIML
eukprot:gb/GFBE01073016.1/.p1 GENE.gb/GFBE01073016.1/~~gb/GFBE01073016.1/.p1  ORF type:complete len:290 (+),score=63.58 gb/GFBE01073016.1/:1-870(+)